MVLPWNVPTPVFAALNRAARALVAISAPVGGPRRCAAAGPATAAMTRTGNVAMRTSLDRMALLLSGVAGLCLKP